MLAAEPESSTMEATRQRSSRRPAAPREHLAKRLAVTAAPRSGMGISGAVFAGRGVVGLPRTVLRKCLSGRRLLARPWVALRATHERARRGGSLESPRPFRVCRTPTPLLGQVLVRRGSTKRDSLHALSRAGVRDPPAPCPALRAREHGLQPRGLLPKGADLPQARIRRLARSIHEKVGAGGAS